jgi:hypothetical protein
MVHRQALAMEGKQQPAESLPGTELALVPAAQLPPARELERAGPDSGPQGFRPRRTTVAKGAEPAVVHLCEHLACQLPQERFWEGAGGGSGGRRQGGDQLSTSGRVLGRPGSKS